MVVEIQDGDVVLLGLDPSITNDQGAIYKDQIKDALSAALDVDVAGVLLLSHASGLFAVLRKGMTTDD